MKSNHTADSPFTFSELRNEEWRAVVGCEGLYEVSSLGRVRKVGKAVRLGRGDGILATTNNPDGRRYAQVWLRNGSSQRIETVHRLVAAAFIGPAPPRCHVNHIDAVKRNNRATNLEYCSPRANAAHAKRMGLYPSKERSAVRKHPASYYKPDGSSTSADLSAKEVVSIRRALLSGEKGAVIGRRFGVGRMCISQIKTGQTWNRLETLRDEVARMVKASQANQTSKSPPFE